MKLRTAILLTLVSLFTAFPAMAMTLDDARRTGAVGERLDGLLTVLRPSPKVNTLVADINTKRQKEYQRISKQNGQPVDIVAKLAAKQIINKLPPKSIYQAPNNGWVTR